MRNSSTKMRRKKSNEGEREQKYEVDSNDNEYDDNYDGEEKGK